MLAVNGFFVDGRFTPIEVTPLPRRFPAILVFNEADAEGKPKHDKAQVAAWLDRLHKAVDASMNEELPDLPPQQPMRPPLDFGD
jgi:hypothetical protein